MNDWIMRMKHTYTLAETHMNTTHYARMYRQNENTDPPDKVSAKHRNLACFPCIPWSCTCGTQSFRKLRLNSLWAKIVKCSLLSSAFAKLIRFISLVVGLELKDGLVGLSQGKSAKSVFTSFSSGIRKMKNDSICTWSYFIIKVVNQQRHWCTIRYKSKFITDLRSSTIVLRASYSCVDSLQSIMRRGIKLISSGWNTGSLAFGLSFTYSIGLSLKSSTSSCILLDRSLIAGQVWVLFSLPRVGPETRKSTDYRGGKPLPMRAQKHQ